MSNQKISSNVPAAARKQVRDANRIIAELNAPPSAQGQPPAQPAQQPTLQPATRFEVQPFDPNAAPPAGAEPAPTAQPVAAPTPAPTPPADDEMERLRQSQRVLQGKYDKETARLMGAAQALQDENNRLLRRLQEAHTPPPAPAQPTREQQFDLSAISQKERDDYGEELLQVMAKIAKANGSPQELTQLRQQVTDLQGQLQRTQQVTAQSLQERVFQALNEWNPMWKAINVSQEFLDWLDVPDIISGLARKTGLMNAFGNGDAQRVVGIFKAYVEEDARSRPAPAPTPPPRVDVNSLVAPGQPRGSATAAPGQGGKIWSEQEINDFYSRVQRKRISDEERTATQNEINLALKEGRVKPDAGRGGVANSV